MNQRRYIEHNLFLQSSYTISCSSLTQVMRKFSPKISYAYLLTYLVKVLTQYLTQVLRKFSPKISYAYLQLSISMNLVTHFFIHK